MCPKSFLPKSIIFIWLNQGQRKELPKEWGKQHRPQEVSKAVQSSSCWYSHAGTPGKFPQMAEAVGQECPASWRSCRAISHNCQAKSMWEALKQWKQRRYFFLSTGNCLNNWFLSLRESWNYGPAAALLRILFAINAGSLGVCFNRKQQLKGAAAQTKQTIVPGHLRNSFSCPAQTTVAQVTQERSWSDWVLKLRPALVFVFVKTSWDAQVAALQQHGRNINYRSKIKFLPV